ncbi:MAG: pyridoxamine 5'-phosphate oxidase [Hyphomicrobium sp.]|nr:MAG: pyridoxamine 5'-phosphate oxidase [Hyphomicrobium sp.]PPD01463.1 MAG: pyridoxamine 5'-phosphate oxidase [Hyphomicrobium sp.]
MRLPQAPIPTYYNDLAGSLQEAWQLLSRGAVDRRSPIHTPAIATVALDGTPRVRIVVLRHIDPTARTLRFHTDKRANKIAEIERNPAVQVLCYDPSSKIQLRLLGRARVHHADDVAHQAFTRSQPQSQLCYRQSASPGSLGSEPTTLTDPAEHDGEQNFTAVVVQIDELEWLYLAAAGHRRARYTWSDGNLKSTWLAP